MEDQPGMFLKVNGERFESTRDNTSLYTFLGQAAFNHIFVVASEDPPAGFYVWSHQNGYDEMEDYMVTNDYPMHLNAQEVSHGDRQAYDEHIKEMCDDLESVPSEWVL